MCVCVCECVCMCVSVCVGVCDIFMLVNEKQIYMYLFLLFTLRLIDGKLKR